MSDLYHRFQTLRQKIADLSGTIALLSWDQETYMPKNGAEFRARQLATLSGLSYEWQTSAEMEELLLALESEAGLTAEQQKNVEVCLKDFRKSKKLSKELIEATSRQVSLCFNRWIEARETKNFSLFATELDKLIALKIEEADRYGWEDHPYNALLELYEEENNISRLDELFGGVQTELKSLLDRIAAKPAPSDEFLYHHYPKDQQWNFSIRLLESMGYDFTSGRQDYVVHPFCTTIAPGDVRVTTKVDEHFVSPLLWGSIHEGGHALYEQGLPASSQYGMPLAEAISMSVHESQSRIWENNVGRGANFWKHHYPAFQAAFPDQTAGVSLQDFLRGINKVAPSLIRIEADELTYHFHIMIRYELEKQLIGGSLKAADLPEAWNALYKKYLGIEVPSLEEGCLQDVHWSHGYFGYFPTYSQGSFMAAQWYAHAQKSIPGLDSELAAGNCKPLLDWLRENIHRHGRGFTSKELLEKVTGEPLSFRYFLEYARNKYGALYSL